MRTLATALLRSNRFFLNKPRSVNNEPYARDDPRLLDILNDLDYKNWESSSSSEFPILVYRGLSASTAAKVAQEIAQSQPQTLPEIRLYSFRNSMPQKSDPSNPWCSRQMRDTNTQNLFTIGNLLKQLLEKTGDDEQRLELIEVFLGKLYRSDIEPEERRKISGARDELGALTLMSLCTIHTLWLAFKGVVLRAREIKDSNVQAQKTCGNTFALILDLNNIDIDEWFPLIKILRQVFKPRMSGGNYSWAKLLIVNPPRHGELGLRSTHEILVEWGNERKGTSTYKPHVPRITPQCISGVEGFSRNEAIASGIQN